MLPLRPKVAQPADHPQGLLLANRTQNRPPMGHPKVQLIMVDKGQMQASGSHTTNLIQGNPTAPDCMGTKGLTKAGGSLFWEVNANLIASLIHLLPVWRPSTLYSLLQNRSRRFPAFLNTLVLTRQISECHGSATLAHFPEQSRKRKATILSVSSQNLQHRTTARFHYILQSEV